MVTPPASFIPSTSAPSSSSGGVTLEAIVAQLEHMDARLDTLSDDDIDDEDEDATSSIDDVMTGSQ